MAHRIYEVSLPVTDETFPELGELRKAIESPHFYNDYQVVVTIGYAKTHHRGERTWSPTLSLMVTDGYYVLTDGLADARNVDMFRARDFAKSLGLNSDAVSISYLKEEPNQ